MHSQPDSWPGHHPTDNWYHWFRCRCRLQCRNGQYHNTLYHISAHPEPSLHAPDFQIQHKLQYHPLYNHLQNGWHPDKYRSAPPSTPDWYCPLLLLQIHRYPDSRITPHWYRFQMRPKETLYLKQHSWTKNLYLPTFSRVHNSFCIRHCHIAIQNLPM